MERYNATYTFWHRYEQRYVEVDGVATYDWGTWLFQSPDLSDPEPFEVEDRKALTLHDELPPDAQEECLVALEEAELLWEYERSADYTVYDYHP